MKAGIIAAGEGSRLKSEGIAMPKPLVPVGGTPLIERLIGSFQRAGIEEIVCIINAESIEVKDFIEGRDFGIPIKFVVKTTPSSMHSFFALAPFLQGGPFLLSTVDPIFLEDEFRSYLRYAGEHPEMDGILAITNFVDDENPLYVELGADQQILGFSKIERTSWVTGGLYILSHRVFREIDTVLARKIERLRNFLGHLVANGYRLGAFPFSKIVDVDHRQDIDAAEAFLRAG